MDGHVVRQSLPSVCQSCCQGRAPVRTRSRNVSFCALHRSAPFATLWSRYNACRARAGDAFATRVVRRSVPPPRGEAACFFLLTLCWARRRICLCAPAYTRPSRPTLMLSRATGRCTFVAAPCPLIAHDRRPAHTRLAATGTWLSPALAANARRRPRLGGRRAAGGPMTAKAARLLRERVQ